MSHSAEVNGASRGQGAGFSPRNRVKELRRVKASDLRPNPKNWRTHPENQAAAMDAILEDVGFAGAMLAREDTDGTLVLIDGHLRTERMGDVEVPVLVLDVDEAEADKLLLTFDPIGALAEADATKLDEVLRTIETESEGLRNLLSELQPPTMLACDPPPATVAQAVEDMEAIKSQRKKGNEATASKNDTEKYLVIVYRSRELKEAALAALNLPSDERYISSDAITIRPRYAVPMQTDSRPINAANVKNSGATG